MTSANAHPPVLTSGRRVLVVTESFPPRPGGAATTMHNLLAAYDPESYAVATSQNLRSLAVDTRVDANVHHLMTMPNLPTRFRRRWIAHQRRRLASHLHRLIEQIRPATVLGVFPDLDFFEASFHSARSAGIPFAAYLHDLPAAVMADSQHAERAVRLEQEVMRDAAVVFTMSDGMTELLSDQYPRVTTYPLRHTFPEGVPTNPSSDRTRVLPTAFWGGAVHTTNSAGVRQFVGAAQRANLDFVTTTDVQFVKHALGTELPSHVRSGFQPSRESYLRMLPEQGVLLLAVDWPDESELGADELATVFPTKTIEYLAAERPIVARCPEDYFLARFMRDRGIGTVIDDRDPDRLTAALAAAAATEALSDYEATATRQALELFSPAAVRAVLEEHLNRVVT